VLEEVFCLSSDAFSLCVEMVKVRFLSPCITGTTGHNGSCIEIYEIFVRNLLKG
jgi:hypothetical protein